MNRAYVACVNGMSLREAAAQYGVPKSKLGDRISGRVLLGAVSGPLPYLSSEEEDELVKFLLCSAAIGYPKSRKEVLSIVQNTVEKKNCNITVTNGWWEGFCHRHPNITLRTPAPLSKARVAASDPDVVQRYFDLLEQTMTENDIIDKPCQIFTNLASLSIQGKLSL